MFYVHSKQGVIKSINGFIKEEKKGAVNIVQSNETECLQKALDFVGAEEYKWENEKEEKWLKLTTKNRYATFFPKGELVWYSSTDSHLSPSTLAYKFEIYATKPLSKANIFVAVETLKILGRDEIIHHIDAVGSATTGYSGNQNITTDYTGSMYRLREAGRGNGVETYDMQNDVNYSNAIDFTNTSNNWASGTPQTYLFALDAHFGAEMTYDYYLNKHNRNSIDGNGFKLKSYVHYDLNYGNAFWNGNEMTYGDGTSGVSPFTTLDVVGHEITHGLTSNTAGLIYSNESGALNESFSDIFGVSIEWFAKPSQANWLIGDERGSIIRNMGDPNSVGDPDTYKGANWVFGTSDNGGVHTNSNVQNYWFYLLVNGGSGTNDNGDVYNVSPLGQLKAEKIAFRNLTNYIISTSNYNEARYYSIQSTIDLYGACSPEVKSVVDAWFAVGVGNAYVSGVSAEFSTDIAVSCQAPFTVDFQNLSVNASSYTWNFGDGTTSSLAFPTHTYTVAGVYNVSLVSDGGSCGSDQEIKNAFIEIDETLPCTDMIPNVTVTKTICEGVLFDDGGENGNYTSNQNSYALISPNSGLPFDLNIDLIDIEAESGCGYDYLKIYDGTSASNLIATICNGSTIGSSVHSSSGSLYLHFHSDVAVENNGFKVSWNCTEGADVIETENTCMGTNSDSGGETGGYSNDEISVVVIAPIGATQVSVSFTEFDVEEEANCNYDYVAVYDGNSVNAPLIGKYCNGNVPPSVIQSSGNALTIKFFSDFSLTKEGFVYNWTCETSGVGVQENSTQQVSVYPNPTQGIFKIEFSGINNLSFVLRDLLGKEVLSNKNYSSNSAIDISQLAKGTYLLELYDNGVLIDINKLICN